MFVTLTGLFDQVGMNMNVCKTVGVVYHPCQVAGLWADEAYTQRVTGLGVSYKEIQRERFGCPEFKKYVARVHCLLTSKPRTA